MLAFAAILLLSGCNAKHTCVFDQYTAADVFLASDANCTQPATYYSSCICGKMGTDTFPAGEVMHVTGDWQLWRRSTCEREGEYRKSCNMCSQVVESKQIPVLDHVFQYGVCSTCYKVNVNESDGIVELGIPSAYDYLHEATANCVWDLMLYDGKIYRGAGDYGENSGRTTFWAYDIAAQKWQRTGTASDESIHRFVMLDGVPTAIGTDPIGGPECGNFYQLINGGWKINSTVSGGVHVYDMVVLDGKFFAAIGTNKGWYPISVSADGIKFEQVPFYKNGALLAIDDYDFSRVYELLVCNNKLYAVTALYSHSGDMGIVSYALFRYVDGRMEYIMDASPYFETGGASYNYINVEFNLNDSFYFGGYQGLFAVSDFEKEGGIQKIVLPGEETVADYIVDKETVYILCYTRSKNTAGTYDIVIYKTTTMQEGSFEKVKSFTYAVCPLSFVKDRQHFYIGMGNVGTNEKNGMLLRIDI